MSKKRYQKRNRNQYSQQDAKPTFVTFGDPEPVAYWEATAVRCGTDTAGIISRRLSALTL